MILRYWGNPWGERGICICRILLWILISEVHLDADGDSVSDLPEQQFRQPSASLGGQTGHPEWERVFCSAHQWEVRLRDAQDILQVAGQNQDSIWCCTFVDKVSNKNHQLYHIRGQGSLFPPVKCLASPSTPAHLSCWYGTTVILSSLFSLQMIS